jgi:histone-lysine N-methyltransferase EZH2
MEKCFLLMTIQECGMSDAVLETLARDIERAPDDIKARYEILQGEKPEGSSKKVSELNVKMEDVYGDKDLDAALDSFDNLFCRRCLVFDCKLHGCSQDLVFPVIFKPMSYFLNLCVVLISVLFV